jgi:RsmE family RNA methyltransferase
MNLVIVDPAEIDDRGHVLLRGPRATHIITVLGARLGQTVRVGLLDGPLGRAEVRSVSDDAVELHCSFDTVAPTRPLIDLLLALPRPKVLRRLWAQLAALGVGRIMLTNAERVERNYFDTHVLTPECYRPLLIEGLQQARDTRLPQVSVHKQFKVLVEDHLDALIDGRLRIVADPAAPASVNEVIGDRRAERVVLAVGPEGGWNDFERHLLQDHGFQPIGMGPRTLRTDTACISLLALVNDALSGG